MGHFVRGEIRGGKGKQWWQGRGGGRGRVRGEEAEGKEGREGKTEKEKERVIKERG